MQFKKIIAYSDRIFDMGKSVLFVPQKLQKVGEERKLLALSLRIIQKVDETLKGEYISLSVGVIESQEDMRF